MHGIKCGDISKDGKTRTHPSEGDSEMRLRSSFTALALACCWAAAAQAQNRDAAQAQNRDAAPPAGARYQYAPPAGAHYQYLDRAADEAMVEDLDARVTGPELNRGYWQPNRYPSGHWRYYNPNNAWFIDNSNNWSTYDPQTYSMWQRYYPGSAYLGNRGYYDNRYFANRHYANPYGGSRYYRGRYYGDQRYYSGMRGRW